MWMRKHIKHVWDSVENRQKMLFSASLCSNLLGFMCSCTNTWEEIQSNKALMGKNKSKAFFSLVSQEIGIMGMLISSCLIPECLNLQVCIRCHPTNLFSCFGKKMSMTIYINKQVCHQELPNVPCELTWKLFTMFPWESLFSFANHSLWYKYIFFLEI